MMVKILCLEAIAMKIEIENKQMIYVAKKKPFKLSA